MTSWHSYPKIYNIGHYLIKDLFTVPVQIEEKVDGSQFSFGIFEGELKCRSKGQQLIIDAPEKMFSIAVEQVKSVQHLLVDGYTYRGEYLRIPKHNSMTYDRIPAKNIIIFDICTGEEQYMSYVDKQAEATRLGFETVPLIYSGLISDANSLLELLNRKSILGSVANIEGLVVKQYSLFGPDKKVLLGKFVSEEFKEVHGKEWKKSNPTQTDLRLAIAEQYKTEARWVKAVQHLRDAGKLTGTPADIGPLVNEIKKDIGAECEQEIKQKLFQWAMPTIERVATNGAPQWYKEQLVKQQFEAKES